MKLSVASSVLALVMSYGDIFPFVRGVEVGSNLALRASQSHEMGRALVDKTPFRSQWVQVGPKAEGIVGSTNVIIRGMVSTSTDATVVAVGAIGDGGKVRVYKNEGGSLTQMGDDFVGEVPGYTSAFVSLSGDGKVLAIATPMYGSNINSAVMGFVKVYEYDETNNTWTEQPSLNGIKEDGSAHTGYFGSWQGLQLSRDGKTLAVGDKWYNENKGMCKIYKYNGSTWDVVHEFLGTSDNPNVGFNTLSDDGSVVAVASQSKFVTIYEYNSDTKQYDLPGKVIQNPETTTNFGVTLNISSNGKILAIGSTQASESKGVTNIYEKNESGEWVPKGAPITGDVNDEKSSYVIMLSSDGNTVAISSRSYESDKGRIRVFDFVDNTWTQRDNQIEGANNDDTLIDFGFSADGDTIFAGALQGVYAATYKHLQDWKIYDGAFDVNATTGDADVYHLIGDKPEVATVKLYKKDCVGEEIVNNINAVSLVNDSWSSVEHKLMHKLTLDTTKINDDSLLVTFNTTTTGAPKSIGSIDFCTRVETFMNPYLSSLTSSDFHTLVIRHSQKAIDNPVFNSNIHQWSSHGGTNQKWHMFYSDDGFVSLVVDSNRKCMQAASDLNIEEGDCNSDEDSQKFQLIEQDEGYFSLKSQKYSQCVGVDGGSPGDGANIKLAECNNNLQSQQFKYESSTGVPLVPGGTQGIGVTFFETNYKVNFDLTAGEKFSISTTIVSDSEAQQQTNLEVDLTVEPFFCSANSFAAQTDLQQIKQNERVYVCLKPKSDEVKISNLDMKLIGEDNFVYQPIEFGTTSWEADAITEVVADTASDVVRADLFPVASLFAEEQTSMKIEGKAFLEFKNSATRMLNFAPYDMTVELEAVLDEDCSGGLAGIFGALFGK